MKLPDVFHFYLLAFLGVILLLWSWEGIGRFLRRREARERGKCSICSTPWRSDGDVFQSRCHHCGTRLFFHDKL